MHATWNALLRGSEDRWWAIVVMGLACSLVLIPVLPFLPLPASASWPNIALSTFLHIGYSVFLVKAYKHGDLSQVYPIARGSSPLLIALGGMVFAQEHLTLLSAFGVFLVSLGIISLAHPKAGSTRMSVFTALGTGIFIACYSISDAIGARLSGNSFSYAAWLFVLYGFALVVIYRWRDGTLNIKLGDSRTQKAAFSGIISLVGYSVIPWAAALGPMGPHVSATRETSVVFAFLVKRAFFTQGTIAPQGVWLPVS